MSATLGLSQLARIDELMAKRQRVADRYSEQLDDLEGVQIPAVQPFTTRESWFVYVIRLDPRFDRRAVMADLEEAGIPSRPYFKPIHLQPFYVKRFGYQLGDFPVAESLGASCLALPFSSVMTDGEIDYVCDQLVRILNRQPVATGSWALQRQS